MTPSQVKTIIRARTLIAFVDIQERLLPAMSGGEPALANALLLARSAAILQVPTLVTEQYPRGLGPTVAPLRTALNVPVTLEKITFSACGTPAFMHALRARGASDVILCGIEAHVCVLQTCLDLLAEGCHVFVVADAVASRTPENARLGLARMHDAGAAIVSTEMALFELLGQAGTPEFKQVQALLK